MVRRSNGSHRLALGPLYPGEQHRTPAAAVERLLAVGRWAQGHKVVGRARTLMVMDVVTLM
jgi:hypothetical protein